jgi:uncharacterized iron-regulated membrane protein
MLQKMKEIAAKLHLILGLVSGLIVFIVSLTGAIYVFEQEWRELTQSKYLYVSRENTSEAPLSTIEASVALHFPNEKVTNIRVQRHFDTSAEWTHAVVVNTKRKLAISLNPYSATVIGVRNMNTDLMAVTQQIHINLLMGEVGEQIIKWNVLIFFIMVLTGLMLWLPPNLKMLRYVLTFNKAKTKFQVNYDLHRILGFYASIILLVVSLTGIWWVFESVQHAVYDWTHSDKTLLQKIKQPKAPPQYISDFSAEKAFEIAKNDPKNTGWTQAFVQPAKDSATPLAVLMRFPYDIVRQQNRLSFDQFTGKILRADYYQNYSTADKIRVSNYDLHTGRMGGYATKILYFIAALFSASLPITGFLIWFNKSEKRRKWMPVFNLMKRKTTEPKAVKNFESVPS